MREHPEALRNIRAVVFDFDGTLAETRIDFALMRTRTREHIQAWGLWQPGMEDGRYVLEIIDLAAEGLEDALRREQYLAEASQVIEDVEMITCAGAEPFPGVPETMQCLGREGYGIGIITRNCRRGVEAVLGRHHLPHRVLLTRNDVERVKPDPAHLLAALDALEVPADRALMVGDHITDVECGRAAGAFTCGVLTDKTTREELLAAGADLVVESAAALAPVLCPQVA